MLDKYKYTEKEQKQILDSLTLIIDSRENENSHIINVFDKKKIPYKKMAMSNGDYSFFLPAIPELHIYKDVYFDKDIAVERKANANELAGNLSKDRSRIEKELATYKGKMALMIELDTYKDICEGNYRSSYGAKSFLATLHSFYHRYGLNFTFVDKEYAAIYIYYTFYYYLRELIK